MRLSLHASVAHRRQSVFPVPVGDSKIALVPCKKKHKLLEAESGLGTYDANTILAGGKQLPELLYLLKAL